MLLKSSKLKLSDNRSAFYSHLIIHTTIIASFSLFCIDIKVLRQIEKKTKNLNKD